MASEKSIISSLKLDELRRITNTLGIEVRDSRQKVVYQNALIDNDEITLELMLQCLRVAELKSICRRMKIRHDANDRKDTPVAWILNSIPAQLDRIKEEVRQRDDYRCCKCAMTQREHIARYERALPVHRKGHRGIYSVGPYCLESAETLCFRCHEAEHHMKCAARLRDGYACTSCGLSDDLNVEYRREHLPVHCTRGGVRDNEDDWERYGVSLDECISLCSLCYMDRTTNFGQILKRDQFTCRGCGVAPANRHLWCDHLTFHRREGLCYSFPKPDVDPELFIVLCRDCHRKRHPDLLGELMAAGGQIVDQFDLYGQARKFHYPEDVARFRRFNQAVVFFFHHYRDRDRPCRKSQITASVLDLCPIQIPKIARREAAWRAISIFGVSWNLTRPEKKEYRNLADHQRDAWWQARDQRLIEARLERFKTPHLSVALGPNTAYVEIPPSDRDTTS